MLGSVSVPDYEGDLGENRTDGVTLTWKLKICIAVILPLWTLAIGLSFVNIYSYHLHLTSNEDCWKCLFKTYMAIGIATSVFVLLVLCFALPLVFLQKARGIRIYVPCLLICTFMGFMVAVVVHHEYSLISDVLRLWKNKKSLTFFEVNYKCCGVMGPDDYYVASRNVPNSCFKDQSGRPADLYTTGCSTRSFISPGIRFSELASAIVRLALALSLIVYAFIMKWAIPR